ncbi:MAG: hypothetical protein ACJASQ_000661 [Crocinitomicaceae bacterium]|jgi:hypothetical protein
MFDQCRNKEIISSFWLPFVLNWLVSFRFVMDSFKIMDNLKSIFQKRNHPKVKNEQSNESPTVVNLNQNPYLNKKINYEKNSIRYRISFSKP